MSEVREDAEEKTKRLGMALIVPGPREVFVDLDTPGEVMEFERRFVLLQKLWPLASFRMTTSQSGVGRHAYVTLPDDVGDLGDHERIALQAALGSDPFREILAIVHGRAGYKLTSVFFEKPAITTETHERD